jgi:ArsR family transcriptional regulator
MVVTMNDQEERNFDLGLMLKTLSEPTRYQIVQLLLERHHCSRSLAKTLGITESAVSQHMAVLKKAGLVSSYRHSYHVHYYLEYDAFKFIESQMATWLTLMDQVPNCHQSNPCQFKLDDGTVGCLYHVGPESEGDIGGPMRVAIPSNSDEMLQSRRSGHFGNAPFFTIVSYDDGMNIVQVETVKNVDHTAEGSIGLYEFIMGLKVDSILTVSLGRPLLMRFTEGGVAVFSEGQTPMVGDAANLISQGKVNVLTPEAVCLR